MYKRQGFNIHLFPTGQGNIVGNPIEPVVKLTANPLTVKGMGEHIAVSYTHLTLPTNREV